MKLNEQLLIGGERVTTIKTKLVQLDVHSPGRASFEIVTTQEPRGLVELQIGYDANQLKPYFLGVIEAKHFSNGVWYLTCRELLGALSFNTPIAIRHASIAQVLDVLAERGLEFVLPEANYTRVRVPTFYHSGTGIEALRQIGRVWQIPNYLFQQRPDGKIYVGSWNDSRWPNTEITNFAEHAITVSNSQSGELIAVPTLRPGIKINGRYITEVTLNNDRMQLRWSNKLFAA